jgi:hypothetical protein
MPGSARRPHVSFSADRCEADFQALANDYIFGLYRDGRTFSGEFYKVLLSTSLRKLAASSREAVLPTLALRKARLEEFLAQGGADTSGDEALRDVVETDADAPEPIEELPGSKTRVPPERRRRMQEEIRDLGQIIERSSYVGSNAKFAALLQALKSNALAHEEKVLIFSEYRRTQAMLVERLAGAGFRVAAFHGGLPHRRPATAKEEGSRRFAATRQAGNQERESKIERLERQMEPKLSIECVNAAFVEVV